MPREFQPQESYQEETISRDILAHAGKIAADAAKFHDEVEFSEFRKAEELRLEFDFDRALEHLPPPPGAESPTRKRESKV